MAEHYHALVWIDHHQAKIFHFDASGSDREVVHSTNPHQHLHHKANSQDSGHAPLDKPFLRQVAEALAPAGAILITGPGSAKTELSNYIELTHSDLARRISGVESVDHPTDGQLVALARSFFKADDRMHSQLPPRGTSE
jgi:stalled ribosome rescue protein Dom34